MHCAKAIAPILTLCAWATAADFNGAAALEATRQIVAIGPRGPGTPGGIKMQAHLRKTLAGCGCQVTEDAFTAKTPKGAIPMRNFIAKFPGSDGARARALVVSGHYDTKILPGIRFVGANDGGASAGLLVELARALKGRSFKSDIYLVWFDGEEAIRDWSPNDSLYGSRHLAEKWFADRTLARINALINVDMIGDRDLQIVDEMYSTDTVKRVIRESAASLGFQREFSGPAQAIEDDHFPFLKRGVRAVDLIDFEYGPNHSWWHTAEDTMDKLSAKSLEAVGRTVLEALRRLD